MNNIFASKLIDIIGSPSTWVPAMSWPKFSYASYLNCTSLKDQGYSFATVIDGGANIGQFTIAANEILKPKRIHSFEPVSATFTMLTRNVRKYDNITLYQMACGDSSGSSTIHINRNSQSSSLLSRADVHEQAFPEQSKIASEEIKVVRLDECLRESDLVPPTLMKLDVQGFEIKAIMGCEKLIKSIDLIMLETSFDPLYVGETPFNQLNEFMIRMGFEFVRPINFLRDPTSGAYIQMDCLYHRKS
jgi:FkbM family methyltransferase